MNKIGRWNAARRRARDKVARLQGVQLLPMPYRDDSAKLSIEEWYAYRARCARYREQFPEYEAGWRRPEALTAETIWPLFADHGLQLKTLTASFADGAMPDERHELELTAKEGLVVALDCVIRAGRHGGQATYNMVFDALAEKWSDWYRRAQETSGARQVRDMREDTAKAARRDLLRNGVLLNELWQIATGEWSRTTKAENPLYWLTRVPMRGYRVEVNEGESILAEFERLVRDDPSYRPTERGWRLLPADDPLPPREPRAEICAERAYNVVQLGPASERMLTLQAETRLLFNAAAFEDDYRRYAHNAKKIRDCLWERFEVDADAPGVAVTRAGRYSASERQEQVLRVDVRLRAGVKCLVAAYDDARRYTATFASVHERVQKTDAECIPIKTGMYRVKNRRYQPTHFWPSAVSGNPDEDSDAAVDERVNASQRSRWFGWPPDGQEPLVGRDISGSQTQILALLLGLDRLGDIAHANNPSFNQYLAQLAWRLHTEGKITLNDGYRGATDPKLKALVNTLWMRVLYGSRTGQVVLDQDADPKKYGPGWVLGSRALKAARKDAYAAAIAKLREHYKAAVSRAKRLPEWAGKTATRRAWEKYTKARQNANKKSGKAYAAAVKRAGENALNFLVAVPGYESVDKFLQACQQLAEAAVERDPYAGVVFKDPLDGAKIRWNPVKRADVELPSDGQKLILSLPGTKTRRAEAKPVKPYKGDYPVDRQKLKQMVAPCLIHMLDAHFSSLVMQHLAKRGVRDFVGIHDAWLIPLFTTAAAKVALLTGATHPVHFLEGAIQNAAATWYRSLGPVYDQLLDYLQGTTFEAGIQGAKAKWKERLQTGWRPFFASAAAVPW